MKKIIIIAVVLLLIAGAGVGAFLFMKQDSPAAVTDGEGAEVAESEQAAEPLGDPIYLGLDPAFVVNFEHNGSIRYLQLSLQIMAYEEAVLEKVSANMPAVRNKLILLLSGQEFDSLNTLEGKENLRKSVLDAINEVLHLSGDSSVNEVFFTAFVIQ